jgi:nucleoside-diphosphate-sugar epimerase
MVHVDDVVQALRLAAGNPAANGRVYLVTDGHAYSTREIYTAICRALGREVPRWTLPLWALRCAAIAGDAVGRVAGRSAPLNSAALDKLLGSAWYSSDKIQRELGFVSSHTLYDALPGMVAEYQSRRGGGGAGVFA